MSGHYIDLAVDCGELSVQFTCTHKRGAPCHKQHPDPEVESFDIDDPAVEDSDECWASSWWDASGLEGLVVNCAAGVIARVPVDITYDEGIEATPITEPEPEALFAVDPAPTEAELTAGDLAVAIEVARERAELLAAVRPNPDDAAQVEVGAEALWRAHYGPICWDSRYADPATKEKCRAEVRAVLTALAAMGGERS